jgi:GxxExxY protein
VFEKIIVELKAISALGANEEAQLLNYLKATGMRLGLLINFGAQRKLEWKRMIS